MSYANRSTRRDLHRRRQLRKKWQKERKVALSIRSIMSVEHIRHSILTKEEDIALLQ